MRARTKSIIFKICELVVLLAPMIVLICVRADRWFVQKDVVNVSLGFIISIVVVCCMLMGYAKKIKAPLKSLICLVIAYLLKSIISDLYLILFCSTIGLFGSLPFKYLFMRYKNIADIVRDEYVKTYARSEAMKEIEEKKNKELGYKSE